MEGKNFIAMVYFNGRYMGYLLPEVVETKPLKLNLQAKQIIIEPQKKNENNLTMALITINGAGELRKINVEILNPMVEQWISLH